MSLSDFLVRSIGSGQFKPRASSSLSNDVDAHFNGAVTPLSAGADYKRGRKARQSNPARHFAHHGIVVVSI
jgi:hypothetical protein